VSFSRQSKPAKVRIAAGKPEHVMSVIEYNGLITLLGPRSETTRIYVGRIMPSPGDAAGGGPFKQPDVGLIAGPFESDEWALISETGAQRIVVARGPKPDLEAMYRALSKDLLGHLVPSGRRRGAALTTVVTLGLGMLMGAALINMPINVRRDGSQMQMPVFSPLESTTPPLGSIPGWMSKIKVGTVSQPPVPVSLDSQPMGPLPPVSHPAAGQRPDVHIPVAPALPSATPKPQAAAQPVLGTPKAGPHKVPPALAAAIAKSNARIADIRNQMAAIQTVTEDIMAKKPIDPATLAELPPAMAAQIVGITGAPQQTLSDDAIASAGHDKYGVPTVPDSMSWAGIGGPQVPLPGGGDINTPQDMRSFGFAP
jgi:hypothetical protein